MGASAADEPQATRYDGVPLEALRDRLGLPALHLYESVASTQDVAHALAGAGALAGTLVLADAQRAGRGRQGRRWESPPGRGIWMTLIERPHELEALTVLSTRIGLAAAMILDPFAGERVSLKWPNDLHVAGGKVGGILIETRWRDRLPDWLAIGIGLNVQIPAVDAAAGLPSAPDRVTVLERLVPAVRAAAAAHGTLGDAELRAHAARDMARGRRCVQPAVGTVAGITAEGALLVEAVGGAGVAVCRSGSLVFAEDA